MPRMSPEFGAWSAIQRRGRVCERQSATTRPPNFADQCPLVGCEAVYAAATDNR